MNQLSFSKFHGCRNSFIIVWQNDLESYLEHCQKKPSNAAQYLCSRSYGIGSDGLMIVGNPVKSNSESYFVEVDMFNPDGSSMGMCGNGVRCITHFLYKEGRINNNESKKSPLINLNVGGRKIICQLDSIKEGNNQAEITVDMGMPILEPQLIPVQLVGSPINQSRELEGRNITFSAVSMGNPHCVIFNSDLEPEVWGPKLENWQLFPQRTNVEFVKVIDEANLEVTVWERGAGFTEACGTGACAVVVAANKLGFIKNQATVKLAGGELSISIATNDGTVLMTGPSEYICRGNCL
jgi:diaminopimelate epimerase